MTPRDTVERRDAATNAHPVNRRALLTGAGAAAVAALTPAARAARRPRPLALADITVRQPLARDFAGTLMAVKAMGYSHFGFRLYPFSPREAADIDPLEKARMVRNAGLAIGVVRLGATVPYEAQIDLAARIGAPALALTTAPVFIAGKLGVTTRAAFDAWLPGFAALGARARKAGVTLAYHNHWYDLTPLDGATPLDLLIDRTDPRDVAFEIDLAWAWAGGVDPLALVRRLGRRVVSTHIKDVRAGDGPPLSRVCLVGDGAMDYPRLLPALDRVTDALGTVEVDASRDGLADAARAHAFVARVRATER